jgi:serine/threonine-protein kinase SRPK3
VASSGRTILGNTDERQGSFTPDIKIQQMSLENEEENLEKDEKTSFLQFLKKMIQWVPEERKSVKELMGDPWLVFP